MILNQIIEIIGKNNFFSVNDFSNRFNIEQEKTLEILKQGVIEGFLIESIDETEFGFRDLVYISDEKFKEYSNWIESNYVLSLRKGIRLNFEETELKDSVLQDLALKRRSDASESVAIHLTKKQSFVSIRDDLKDEMWIYNNGIYEPNGESFIKEYCRKILGAAYTTTFSNLVIDKIRTDTFENANDFFKKESLYINEIPVKNGILNIVDNNLSIFTPNKVFFNKINANYDFTADCPNIKKFLKDILKNKDNINLIFEIIGTSLYKKYIPQVAIGFLGEGENGKGVLGNLITNFLCEKNCTSLSLNQLTPDSFSVHELFGKLVNIAGDVGNNDLKDTGRFKELTSGTDLITAKRKFQRDLSFKNYAKLIFSFNELPRVYDFTHGFWRRWIILEFPYLFVKKSEYELRKNEPNIKLADTEIIERLTTDEELSGLLNEAINGLKRVLKNKQFSYTKSTEEIKQFWIRKSDSFSAFVMDMIEEDFESYISKKKLRSYFNKYCRKHKIKGTSDRNIKSVLEDQFGVIESRKITDYDSGERENIWEGIRFKSNVKEVNGISTHIEKKNIAIGEKTPDLPDFNKNIKKILDFLKKNINNNVTLEELKTLKVQNLEQILEKLKQEGLIFEPKINSFKYLQ